MAKKSLLIFYFESRCNKCTDPTFRTLFLRDSIKYIQKIGLIGNILI